MGVYRNTIVKRNQFLLETTAAFVREYGHRRFSNGVLRAAADWNRQVEDNPNRRVARTTVRGYQAVRVVRAMLVQELERLVKAGSKIQQDSDLHKLMAGGIGSTTPIGGHIAESGVTALNDTAGIAAASVPVDTTSASTEEGSAVESTAASEESGSATSSSVDGVVVGLHAETRRLLAAVKNRVPALCIGETGTGKTTIVKQVGEKLGREVVRVNLDGGVTPDEIIGRYQARANNGVTETYFQEGVVPRAMRSGAILLLDELNAALPDTLFCLHSLLEAEPRLFIPETQEEIVPAEGFAIVATMNPSHEYAGTKGLNAALYSRFGMVIRFEPLSGVALRKAISGHVPGVMGTPVLERICVVIETVARLRKEEKVSTRLTLREGIAAARFVASGDLKDNEAIESAMLAKMESYEREAVLAGGAR